MHLLKHKFLIDYDGNRENNFTLIRITMAWLVLYGHSFAVQKIPGMNDPLNRLFQGSTWVGELAVNGFFAISGFLVTASLMRRNIFDFTLSRVLRIYPALIVCVILTVFVLGPIMTDLSWSEYFSQSKTYLYLKNALAFDGMQWVLPGVFQDNVRDAVNGSLWSLTVEVKCYTLLALVGVIGLLRVKLMANLVLLLILFVGIFYYAYIPLIGFNLNWNEPALYFLIGVALYINRNYVPLNGLLAISLLTLACFSFGKTWYFYVFPVSYVYLIFYVSYAVKHIAVDHKIGDISYGFYIYAWPVQQIIAHLMPQGNPYTNTVVSSVIVFLLAYISWHKIEKPLLMKKQNILNGSVSRAHIIKNRIFQNEASKNQASDREKAD